MMSRNSYFGLREVEQNLMMTEVCGATNCTMMEMGGAITSMMKVCGATTSTLSKSVRKLNYVCGNRCEMVYFMVRRKLLHRMKEVCGATSRTIKDKLIVGEHQVDGTRLLIYIYIYLYIA